MRVLIHLWLNNIFSSNIIEHIYFQNSSKWINLSFLVSPQNAIIPTTIFPLLKPYCCVWTPIVNHPHHLFIESIVPLSPLQWNTFHHVPHSLLVFPSPNLHHFMGIVVNMRHSSSPRFGFQYFQFKQHLGFALINKWD